MHISWSSTVAIMLAEVRGRLLPVGSLADFREELLGRFLLGPTWLHACVEPELFVVSLWGRPQQEDVTRLVESLRLEIEPGVPAHRSLVDASAVEGGQEDAFLELGRYVHEQHALLSERVERLALVRPSGLAGAAIAGFFSVLDAPYPVRVFDEARLALLWLDVPEAPRLADELSALRAEHSGVSSLLAALRALLTSHRIDADLESAATRLGLSSRTLQRQLRELGTSFRDELTTARLKEAEARMLDSEAPLTAIALDAGFSTLAHFSAAFRKVHGTSPSEWRRERRDSARARGRGKAGP